MLAVKTKDGVSKAARNDSLTDHTKQSLLSLQALFAVCVIALSNLH